MKQRDMTKHSSDLHGSAPDQSPVALLLIDVINDLDFDGSESLLELALPMAEQIAQLKRRARAANVPVRVCGEMGGRPLEAMALIGLGVDQLSITPAGVGPIKAMVRSLDAAAIRARVQAMLAKPPKDMRKALSDWARRHSVMIG